MKLRIQEIACHRNGVAGIGFYAVCFQDGKDHMLATVFPERGAVAVLCLDLIPTKGVAFGENSWRGDQYEDSLRAAIDRWEEQRSADILKAVHRSTKAAKGK